MGLSDDGNVVWDSLSISEYIAELFPDKDLWPRDRSARAWARSICAEMHSSFFPPSKRVMDGCFGQSEEAILGKGTEKH